MLAKIALDAPTIIAVGTLFADAYDAWARGQQLAALDPAGREAALAHLDELARTNFAAGAADAEAAIREWREAHPELTPLEGPKP